MRNAYTIVLLVLFWFFIPISQVLAQEETDSTETNGSSMYSSKKPYYIVMRDGTTYTGFILKDNARELLVKTTTVGEIYIPKANIKSITEATSSNTTKQGTYVGAEDYYNRYMLMPNAFSLPQNEGNVSSTYLLHMHLQYGVTDNFDIGVGTSWLFNPISVAARYTYTIKDNLRMAFGGFGIATTYTDDFFGLAYGYGVLTTGTPSGNFTLGMGYGAIRDDSRAFIFTNQGNTSEGLLLIAGAYKRFAKRFSFLADATVLNNTGLYFAGPGLRYHRKKREGETIDFGVLLIGTVYNIGARPAGFLPVITYTVAM